MNSDRGAIEARRRGASHPAARPCMHSAGVSRRRRRIHDRAPPRKCALMRSCVRPRTNQSSGRGHEADYGTLLGCFPIARSRSAQWAALGITLARWHSLERIAQCRRESRDVTGYRTLVTERRQAGASRLGGFRKQRRTRPRLEQRARTANLTAPCPQSRTEGPRPGPRPRARSTEARTEIAPLLAHLLCSTVTLRLIARSRSSPPPYVSRGCLSSPHRMRTPALSFRALGPAASAARTLSPARGVDSVRRLCAGALPMRSASDQHLAGGPLCSRCTDTAVHTTVRVGAAS